MADGLDADLVAQRINLAAAWRRLSETNQEGAVQNAQPTIPLVTGLRPEGMR
ncbi:MAG: hypothetical protein ACJ76Z_11385 [Thermoleophilaceae bacterium]